MATQRFVRRTWRETSEKICVANEIPPGFRIVLVDDARRVKRDDLIVRSGDFGAYPAGFSVSLFVDEVFRNEVRDAEALGFAYAELRDHRGERVSPESTLREVRDMPGVGGKHTEGWWEREDYAREISSEIEDAMNIFEEDFRIMAHPNGDLLLKGVIRYMISRFDMEAVDHILHLYGDEMDAARARERAG